MHNHDHPAEPHTITGYDGRSVIEEARERQLEQGITSWRILCDFYRETLDRGRLSADDLARLSAILLAEDVLRYAEDGVRELRADFKALRDHPAVREAQQQHQPTSPAAERFVQKVAEWRLAFAKGAIMENRI